MCILGSLGEKGSVGEEPLQAAKQLSEALRVPEDAINELSVIS
jgi:hypothetical protein